MSAGLPGLGLGGLFFIFSALLAPLVELWRTLRGRGSMAGWGVAGRQFAQALAMIIAIDLTIRGVYGGLSVAGLAEAPSLDAGTALPLTLLGLTFALLVVVLGAAKLADLALRTRPAAVPRSAHALPLPTPLRSLAVSGATTPPALRSPSVVATFPTAPTSSPSERHSVAVAAPVTVTVPSETGPTPSSFPSEVFSHVELAQPSPRLGPRGSY